MAVTEDELREKASRVKLLILDVDGVLTDGGIIYSANGDELKRFDVKDGHGIKLLMRSGVEDSHSHRQRVGGGREAGR